MADLPVQPCPICGTGVPLHPRYPHYLCAECASRARSRDGRPLAFGNVSVSGGYAAVYADSGAPYDSHCCFVDGIECRADEAHFGGVMIERVVQNG